MKERRDGSVVPEFDIGRKPEATGDQNLQPDSGSAHKILESGESVDQRTDASDLQSSVMSPGRVFPLDELPASQGATGDTSCPETPNSAHGDPVFLDHPGGKAPPCEPETDSQLLDPKSQQENIYGSVLHQMLQQQKHKHGRRYKKKTLMKMARLLVIAKGWDHRENQSLSLQEEMDLKEEISVSIQGKKVPGNPDTSRNLSGEIRSESNSEETKIPPERRRKKATEAPKAAGEKTDETPGGSGSDFTLKNKEEKPKTKKDPELKLRKKAGRKRIGEPESLSVSPGGKQRRKRDPVAQIQITPTASEANGGLSGFAGNTAAQETEPQESKRKPRKSRNPSAERLPTGGDPLPEENRTKPEEEASSLDLFPKLQLEKRGAKTNKMSIWDQLPSAEMSNIQNETGKKRTKTVPAEEETMHWDERRGTFSQKLDEDPIRSWKKPKGQSRKKKIRQQTLNFQSKTQPVWEAPISRLDFSPTNATPANPSTQNQEFTNWDESDEAWKFGKIRRSCTLGTKTSSAADEWLSQYLKGSRRKASCKASNIPELMGKDELENGTKFKQTKRGQKKSTGPSANGETAPGNVKRKGKKAKQESAVELNKDRLGFPTLPASNSVSNRQEEERMRRKRTVRRKTGPKRRRALNIKTGTKILESEVKHPNEGDPGSPEDGKPSSVRRGRRKNVFTTKKEDHETEKSQLMSSFQDKSNTTENGVNPETKGKINLLQIEGTSLKDGSLEVKSKAAPRKMKRSPKKRRILKKHSIIKPKVLESDEKHPDKVDLGTPEEGKTSIQDRSSETGATPETNVMSLLQTEGTAGLTDGSLEVRTVRWKAGPKKRQNLKKNSISEPKILESDEKHPDEGDPGSPEDGKPSSGVRRGRTKNVLPIRIEDEISNIIDILEADKETEKEKFQVMTSELTEPNQISLLRIEGISDPKDDFLETKSKMAPRKMKRGRKKRRMLRKRSATGPKVLESEEKQPQEGHPGTPDGGKSSIQDERGLMDSTSQTGVTPNQINPLQIKEKFDLKDDSLDIKSKTAPRKMKTRPKKRRTLRKRSATGTKMLESDGKHPDEGNAKHGKPSSVKHRRKKSVLPIKMEDEAPSVMGMEESGKEMSQMMFTFQAKSNTTESGSETRPTPDIQGKMNLLQTEGTSDLNDDFQEMVPTKRRRGPKTSRMLRKRPVTEPNILGSEHPKKGAPGTPEDGKPSNQDRNSSMGSGGQTRATPEPDRIILLQIEGTSGLKDDSLNVKSKMAPRKMKKGRKKRRILRKRSTTRAKILDSDEKPEEDYPGASEDGKPSIHDEHSPEDSGGHTGATPEPDRIEGTSARKEDFLGEKTVRRKSGPKRKRVLKKNLKAELKILESEERHPDPGSPEDGKPSSVRSRRKTNDFTIKMEEEPIFIEMGANKESKMEKSQLMFSFQDKSNTTESGSETRATPEVQGKMSLLQTEGVPTDPKDDSGKVFPMVQGQIQSFQKDSARPKIQESGDHPYERDAGASEDGRMSETSNMGHGRKTNVFTIKLENGASDKEPEAEKPFQESASSTSPGKTRQKRRRRSRTHWSGHRKAKKPRVCSFWDVPAVSSSCDQTFNIQQENQENRMTTNAPSGSEISHHLQKKNKSLQCSFCLRSFRHISALTLHKRLHTGRKPYGCSVCAKSFSTLPELKLHSKLHRGPPATHCPICEETFRDKTELIRHLKVHLAEVEGLQTEPGRSRRSRLASGQEETFRCPVCSREFTKKSAFENHRRIHDRKAFRNPRRIHGFHVSKAGDTTVVTPVFFKCPICRQIHRRWCHYVLHLHSHTMGKPHHCYVCRQEYSRAAGSRRHCSVCCRASGEEAACRGSLEDIWKETGDSVSPRKISAIPEEEGNGKAFIPPPSSGGSSPSVIEDFDVDVSPLNFGFSHPTFSPEPPRLSLQSWCGRFGNKRRPHRRAFRCSRCELEFHFLGSYMDHLQEHAPKTPNACLSCNKPRLEPRVRQPDGLKCSTCGKLFSTSRNLRKHKLLHKAAHSHICLPCGRSFPGHSALEAHLEAHRRRLSVPRPARVEEPFLFPYPCRKCSARFSSTDLLEAHQVCHSFAGRKPESPPESILSFIPNPQTVAVSSPGPKRWLLVSNRKDLFRYPHPDHLYVVPAASSETPTVVSETPDIGLDLESGANPTSAELQLQLLVKSLIPEKRLTTSDSSDSEDEPTVLRQNCAICMQTFTDVATLHEHYRNHARGM
ncbi:uncharacterized protein LOC103143479 [Poecilia formosa]|uniref:uncharacterized protein LOC103143479 n=1 Tax=Poecilia formosa TaxID=48698 RepID=UPI0004448C35|nr:PREDICTED: uncharacterized protein LOC103143479 [Poecilia formosa]XP_016530852.1 PREDICTED: uncharacterized protein LOC103143479 [Poecilia formosa]